MNFFQLFQIAYATHFILGAYLALRMWRFTPAVLRPWMQPSAMLTDVLISIATTVLSVCWYFVWYGSIVFALRGRFPALSPRPFSILFGSVYTGLVIVNYAVNQRAMTELSSHSPFYGFIYGVVMLVAAGGAVFLPGLKMHFDSQQQRLAQERDRRLDELHPWNSSSGGGDRRGNHR